MINNYPFKLHNTTLWSAILNQHYVPVYRTDFLAKRDSLKHLDWTVLIGEMENSRKGFAADLREIANRFQDLRLRSSRPEGLQFSYGRMIELTEILDAVGEL